MERGGSHEGKFAISATAVHIKPDVQKDFHIKTELLLSILISKHSVLQGFSYENTVTK